MKLNRLSLKDKRLFGKFLAFDKHLLSPYAFANIYIWKSLFEIYWCVIDGALSIFFTPLHPAGVTGFKDNAGSFMYLAPLADKLKPAAVCKAFAVMDGFNKNKGYSRIENVEAASLAFYENLGYKYSKKSCDYLCRRADLAELKGDAFKSKRAARNYFLKNYDFEYSVFTGKYKKDCLNLYTAWANGRRRKSADRIYCGMLDDNFTALKILLEDYRDLGITGRIVLIGDEPKAFTFGFPLNKEIFCILYEITDLRVKGLSQFIFQRFSDELKDYKYINIMDDSGLDNLKKVKLSYRPPVLVPSYTILNKLSTK